MTTEEMLEHIGSYQYVYHFKLYREEAVGIIRGRESTEIVGYTTPAWRWSCNIGPDSNDAATLLHYGECVEDGGSSPNPVKDLVASAYQIIRVANAAVEHPPHKE